MEVAATTPAEYAAGRLTHPVGLASFACRLGQTLRDRSPIQSATAPAAKATTHARPPESADQTATSASDSEIVANSPASAYRCILVTQCHTRGGATLPTQPRGVAQLVAHRSPKPGVAGSSPVAPVGAVERKPSSCGGFARSWDASLSPLRTGENRLIRVVTGPKLARNGTPMQVRRIDHRRFGDDGPPSRSNAGRISCPLLRPTSRPCISGRDPRFA